MLYSDTIIEKENMFLRNLIKTAPAKDVWSTASSGYGMFDAQYEVPLIIGNLYYVRYTYKFTTTNQSPTWVQYYIQDGYATVSNGRINNPTANVEYTVSGIGRPVQTNTTLTYGTIYNGNSGAIAGVSSQIKNIMFYDVTELSKLLCALGLATTDTAVQTWCDNNLFFSPAKTNYDIRSLFNDTSEKVSIKGGAIITSNFIEPDGMRFYSYNTALRDNAYFDTGFPYSIYNNQGNGTVVHTRIDGAAQNSPFYPEHKYICQITTNGTASPYAGGFYTNHLAAANKIFIEKFVAKIPVGYSVTCHYNSQGTGASISWISPTEGTGDWAEYAVLYKCGSEGSFSTGGHIALKGSNNTSVTWYVAYCNDCDITSDENLKYYTVLKNVERIKKNYYFSNTFNNLNITSSESITTNIPSSWNIDTTDFAGNSNFSIVQPINAGAGTIGAKIPVRAGQRYKVSYWVKCKQDMSSFLTAIRIFINNTEVTHSQVAYKAGTKTQLIAALENGATNMTVKSNANWGTYSYSRLGFRSGSAKSYNDIGTSNGYNGSTGLISGISGTTIVNFNTAYSGNTIPVNTYVVESYDGGTFPYPISKGQLPTDNTWKYVEGYFGNAGLWDGSGGGWANLPLDVTHIMLYINIYSNNGTVPIKYSDIKIEAITGDSRYENKIQIVGGN